MKGNLKKILTNQWVMIIYMTVLIVAAAYFFYVQRGKFAEILATARIHVILLSLTVSGINAIVYPYIHYITYRGLGADVSYWETFRIIYISRLGNYVPGRFWFATNYYIFSRKANISRGKIGKSFIINNSLLFLTGIICALPVISILPSLAQKLFIVLPIVILVLIHPKVLNRVIDTLSSRGKPRKDSQEGFDGLSYSTYIQVFFLYFAAWFIPAVSMYVVLLAFQPTSITVLPMCLSACASSLMIGLLAIFAPAGLGVREGIGVIVLSQFTLMETAVLVMVVMRINQILTELVCGIISAISIYREDRERILATTTRSDQQQMILSHMNREGMAHITEEFDG